MICVYHKVFIKFYLLCTINGRYNTVKENHTARVMNSPAFLSVIFAITFIAVCYSCTVINCFELKLSLKSVIVLMQMSFFTIFKICNKFICYEIIIIVAFWFKVFARQDIMS